MSDRLLLSVGTTKGAFLYRGDSRRNSWKHSGPHFLGSTVNHIVLDPRDRRTLLLAAKTGHLGPTVFRSRDLGRTWKEAKTPPAFRKAREGEKGKAVETVFWLSPGHPKDPGVWFAGTSPHGIFRSEDGGVTWEILEGFERYLTKISLKEHRIGATPGGAITHSILIDPRNSRWMYVGLSTGGFFETRDRGRTWKPLNRGVEASFLPEKNPDYGHDPHSVALHPLLPDRLYQQNHCGIYRLDRPSVTWDRIGKKMPKKIGDIGFPLVLHPRDPETVWVFPMDGTTVWPRTCVEGRPAAYRTQDGGKSWQRQDQGFPRRDAWWTVKRQAFAADGLDPVGLYLGTTSGEVWTSSREGQAWRLLARNLPHIYSVTAAAF